jgi:hypothetical protein
LNRSKITALLSLKACATCDQKVAVKIEDRVEPVLREHVHVVPDRQLVGRSGISRRHSVDPEPAVFVQGDADRVGAPASDRAGERGVAWAVEHPPTLDARELRAGVVDAVEQDRPSRRVDELISRDMKW